jgi:hypothetical protein
MTGSLNTANSGQDLRRHGPEQKHFLARTKELTGAQMSAKEADRLRLAQPDPGEQFWQGDDPVTFKAKMNDVVITTRAAVARYQYYLSQGLSPATVKSMINSGNVVDLETIAGRME